MFKVNNKDTITTSYYDKTLKKGIRERFWNFKENERKKTRVTNSGTYECCTHLQSFKIIRGGVKTGNIRKYIERCCLISYCQDYRRLLFRYLVKQPIQ